MSQNLFRQIGEKLESLFKKKACTFHISPNWREIRIFIHKKKLALFIVDKNAWRVVASDFILFFGWRIFAIL
jgi:hypothetical protein